MHNDPNRQIINGLMLAEIDRSWLLLTDIELISLSRIKNTTVQLYAVFPGDLNIVKASYFHFKGWKIQIFPDFWQLFLILLSKVIQTGFFCLQVIFQSSCIQGKSFWMTFEDKDRKSCQKSGKIWIFHPLK